MFWSVGAANAMGYFRPLRDETDQNYKDYLETDSDGSFSLTVHESGSVLTPTVSAAPTSVTAGKAVEFQSFGQRPGRLRTVELHMALR